MQGQRLPRSVPSPRDRVVRLAEISKNVNGNVHAIVLCPPCGLADPDERTRNLSMRMSGVLRCCVDALATDCETCSHMASSLFLRGLHDGMRQMWRQSIVQSGHAEPAFGGDRICSSFRNRRFSMSLVARKARALSRLPRLLSREARGRSLYEVFLSGLLILLGGHSAASSTSATTKTAPTPPKAATAAASAAEIAAPTASRSTKTAAASAPAATPASASTPYASKPTSAN